jgi:hypothetical protein
VVISDYGLNTWRRGSRLGTLRRKYKRPMFLVDKDMKDPDLSSSIDFSVKLK